MSTRNIVPRSDSEGGIGTSLKKWALGWINNLNVTTINKVNITSPSTGSILTIYNDKTLEVVDDSMLSGINSGDEDQNSIKTKLGFSSPSTDGYLKKEDYLIFSSGSTTNWGQIQGNIYNQSDLNDIIISLSGSIVNEIDDRISEDNNLQSQIDLKLTNASNIGIGEGLVFKELSGSVIQLKTLKAGSNISLSNDNDEITINSSGNIPNSIGTASGDIIYFSASGVPAVLAKATDGQVLTLANGLPSWANADTLTVERVWAIGGEIKVPSGDTDYIVPIPIWVPAGKSVTLNSVEMLINSGTSVTFKIKQKTTAAESYTDVATGLVADTTPSNKIALSSNNVLSGGESGTMFLVAIEVTAVSGTPKNLSVMISYTKTIF